MGYSIFDETMVDMTWPQIEAAIQQNAIVLFPIGVIEEHGPHMGLAVDIYAAYMVARLTKQHLQQRNIPTLIAPPYYWGINGLSSSFAGSFTVRPETMKAVLLDTMTSLKNWGVKYIFTLNWHGEGKHSRTILDAVKEAQALLNLKAYFIITENQVANFRLSGQEDYILVEKVTPTTSSSPYWDIHAGASETAVMLNYFPQQVDVENAKTLQPTQFTGEDMKALRKGGDEARKMIPLGYIGDPAGFDITAGKREVEEQALRYADLIERAVKAN
jgi:creatinine amidohydrolase